MPERQFISPAILHDTLQKKGGAQVYTGTTAEKLAAQGRLGVVMAPDNLQNPGQTDFNIPPEYLSFFQAPASLDAMVTHMQDSMMGLPDPEAQLLYTQYYVAAHAGAEALKGMRGKIPHITMGHTWQRDVMLVGTGDVQTVLDNYRHSIVPKTERTFSEDRDAKEQQILREVDFVVLQTVEERDILAHLYQAPDLTAQQIAEKVLIVPLGVDNKFHLLGSLTPDQREMTRKQGRTEVLRHLAAGNRREDAARLEALPEDTHFFYTVSRLAEGKGNVNAIKAFIEMKKSMYGIDPKRAEKLAMVFCGGPLTNNPVYDKMMAAIAESGDEATQQAIRDSVIFTDWMDGYMAAKMGHTFVGFSDNESFYLVLAEAMAARNSSVLTNFPTIRAVSGYERTLYGELPWFDEVGKPQMIDPYHNGDAGQALFNLAVNHDYRQVNADRNRLVAEAYTVDNSVNILLEQLKSRGLLS